MKRTIVLLLLSLPLLGVSAQEGKYRETLQGLHDRFAALEMKQNDYRASQPRLSPEEEQDRRCLHGQLLRDDPIWAVMRELQADIYALEALARGLKQMLLCWKRSKTFSR